MMRAVLVVLLCGLVAAVPLNIMQVDEADINNGVSQGDPRPVSTEKKVEEINVPLAGMLEPNGAQEFYPPGNITGVYSIKESSEMVAPPPQMDPEKKSTYGVQPESIKLDRPEEIHPMEVITPLEIAPCDPNMIVDVSMPALEKKEGYAFPFLPLRYGCSDEYEGSREKASPEIRWTNILHDVDGFSLEIMSLGDETCSLKGDGIGKILWHVKDMNVTSPNVVLQEAASHDKRMLLGGREEPNQWLEEYYSGPCPPPGTTECYRVKVLAHRSNGYCQCGHVDFLFNRPDKKEYQPWVYDGVVHDKPSEKHT